MTNGPLTALAGGGVYAYGSSSTFPTSTYQASNYWVDVVYSQTSGATVPGAPSGVSATAGNGSASVSWTAPGSGRQRDHQLHGDAVYRLGGADPGDGVREPAATRRR